VQAEMAKWLTSKAGMATPEETEAERTRLMRFYFGGYDLPIPSTMASAAPNSQFKVIGSRPS
jgi:hypothetical protein